MDYSKILPRLYCGSCPESTGDIDALRSEIGVTAVLSLQTEEDLNYWEINWNRLAAHYQKLGIDIRRVPVQDFSPDDLRRKLPRCVDVLNELLHSGRTVYVHCNAGVNRSPSVVIAYLHWIEGWALEQALVHVRACRDCDPYMEAIQLATGDARPFDP
jgi:atypical dual specificity phosphatase